MNANLLRQVSWLWKHRHTHDDDNFQEQITVIRQTVEEQSDDVAAAAAGAKIHLTSTVSQSIPVGGGSIAWNALQPDRELLEFRQPVFPAFDIEIPIVAYYDVEFDLEWEVGQALPKVWVVRNRGGLETTVAPAAEDPGIWASVMPSRRGSWVAKGVSCAPGDEITMYVDHGAGTAQTLTKATATIELVHGSAPTGANYTFDYGQGSVEGEIPSNTQTGDFLISLVSSAEPTVSTPSGWTRHVTLGPNVGGTDTKYVLDYKVAVVGEADITYTVSGGSGEVDVAVLIIRIPAALVDTADPFSGTPDTEAPATATGSVTLGMTTVDDDALLVMAGFSADTDPVEHSYSGGLVKRFVGAPNDERLAISFATERLGVAGATGDRTVTMTPAPLWMAGILFAVKPAP